MPRISSAEFVRRQISILCVLIVACGLLVACGADKKDISGPTGTPVLTATIVPSPTALSGPPRIGDVIWTSAIEPQTNAPLNKATPVPADAALYAVVPIDFLPAGSQLVARWFFNDTSLDALDSAIRIDRDRISGWIEFHIERTGLDSWPGGIYTIIISDGTNELQRADLTIS